MTKYRKGQNPWVLVFGTILTFSILFTMCSSNTQDKLDVYTQSDIVSTESEEATKEPDISTFTYENEQYGFSLLIPEGWDKVTKNGCDTFIHRPSASSVQIQITDYNPAINNINAESISTQVVNDGHSFVNFTRLTNASYEVSYQDMKTSTYDYIEEVFWDRTTIIKLICTFNDSNYEKIYPYYSKIINSFNWNRKNEIPEGYSLYFSNTADFEFGVPTDWTISTSGNAIVCISSDSSAQMTVTVSENTSTLENFTATDMTNLLLTGKNGFMLKSFSGNHTQATATASYNNGEPMTNQTFLFANGFYLYSIQFDYYTGVLDDSIPKTCAALFREFITAKIIEESENINHTELENDS